MSISATAPPCNHLSLQAETAYARAMLADTDALQERLYKEMRGRIQEADEGVPVRHGPFQYYRRTLEGKQYSVHCRRRLGPDASPEPSGKEGRRGAGWLVRA